MHRGRHGGASRHHISRHGGHCDRARAPVAWRAEMLDNAWQTFMTTAVGFLFAVIFGLLGGVVSGSSTLVYDGFYPALVGFNSIPKVAVIPILVIWFGIGTVPAITAFLISFFPILVNPNVVRYSFIAVDLHHLLLAGLPAHPCENFDVVLESRICISISELQKNPQRSRHMCREATAEKTANSSATADPRLAEALWSSVSG